MIRVLAPWACMFARRVSASDCMIVAFVVGLGDTETMAKGLTGESGQVLLWCCVVLKSICADSSWRDEVEHIYTARR